MLGGYAMGRPDPWARFGARPFGFGAQEPRYGAGPRLGIGLGTGPGPGPSPTPTLRGMGMPAGTSEETAKAVSGQLAVYDLLAALNDPLPRQEREEVEEALAVEDTRLWYEGALDAAARTLDAGVGTLDPFGAYGGALGLGDGARPASVPGAMPAPAYGGAGPEQAARAMAPLGVAATGPAPSREGTDIAEAAERTYMKLMEAPSVPVRDLPTITDAVAMVLGDAPDVPEVAPLRPYDAVAGGELAAAAPPWRIDAPAPFDALNAQREAMMSALAQGYERTADAAFGRGLGWNNPSDAALLRGTDGRKAASEVERAEVETVYQKRLENGDRAAGAAGRLRDTKRWSGPRLLRGAAARTRLRRGTRCMAAI